MSDKIKILILNEPEPMGGVTHWRMYRPMLMLEAMYSDQVELIWNRGALLPVDLARADVAIAWRPSTQAQAGALAQIRALGIKVIIDHDDDLLNVPTGSAVYHNFKEKGVVKGIVSLSDMVWTTNEYLKGVYGHPNTHVVPNAVTGSDIPDKPNKITKTVAWRGDFNQVEDLYAFRGEYDKILKRADHFFWFGYLPTWKHPEKCRYTEWTSLINYFTYLRKINLNYLWKPMRKIPFNYGKSNISKLEAVCAGGVCLTNFYDQPDFKNSFREISWKESEVHGAWEAARDEILKNFNLETWTHTRYKLINSILV